MPDSIINCISQLKEFYFAPELLLKATPLRASILFEKRFTNARGLPLSLLETVSDTTWKTTISL